MRVLAGLGITGTTLTGFDELALGRGRIGHAVWGPSQLLRDLELRLGLQCGIESEAVRIARWAARAAELAQRGRFYSKSFEVDALGTARALLRIRDSLVEAGWRGQRIPDAGARLDGLAELESLAAPALPAGFVDRLALVARSLQEQHVPIYEDLVLAQAAELWPSLWQLVFCELERTGTRVARQQLDLPGAQKDCDLRRVQSALRGAAPNGDVRLEGDGSFVLLTADTSWEAARAAAAIVADLPPTQTAVIREGDVSALDNALAVHGLRTQGWRSVSTWRAALQVWSLALELAFEPKDPHRVLELVTLPVGPFSGWSGRLLAKALTQSPGIGSPSWEKAKARIVEVTESLTKNAGPNATPGAISDRGRLVLTRIADWLEYPGHDAVSGAPKADLVALAERVRAWLVNHLPSALGDATVLAAIRHTDALRAALDSEARPHLSLVEVRRIAEFVREGGIAAELIEERAGRVDHVDVAENLQVPRANVLWWSFADTGSSGIGLPWRKRELGALSSAGIRFPDPKARLAERAEAWRRAILAATERVIFVAPDTAAGEKLRRHPLWDEIVARTGADEAVRARITVSTSELRNPAFATTLLGQLPLNAVNATVLPGGSQEWVVATHDIAAIDHLSAASLNALLGCPLRWALGYRAGINAGGHALPPLFIVNGALGHRLIELLHQQAAFGLPAEQLRATAEVELDRLFQSEGAILLRAGMAFERFQLRRQLVDAVLELSRMLKGAKLRILAVEKGLKASWRGSSIEGRIDLLVGGSDDFEAIVDVKWGLSSYRELLRSGQALQLAVYAFAHATERGQGTLPEATYFSLKQQRLFGLPSAVLPNAEEVRGPSLSETWQRIERSVEKVERVVTGGRFAVTGLRRSLPLLTALGVSEAAHASHFALEPEESCKYCSYDALCGQRWEANDAR